MNLYFVYSSGGGAGDWNAIDRIFLAKMPPYFKDYLLIKFGDIYFNHRSNNSILKPGNWNNVKDVRKWVESNTNDNTVSNTTNLLLDVGTTKIVSYITHNDGNLNGTQIIKAFEKTLKDKGILEKYCKVVVDSDVNYAVTFDIPNLFKVRTQAGNVSRNLFTEGCREDMLKVTAGFANEIYAGINKQENRLLTIINALWSDKDIEKYLNSLDYTPTKLGIGGLTDFNTKGAAGRLIFSKNLERIDKLLNLQNYSRVHFLGSGGLSKALLIKQTLGNHNSFSADNTTPYNRAIDGNTNGSAQSKYIDYINYKQHPITQQSKNEILQLHAQAYNTCFTVQEMTDIIDNVIQHQSSNSSHATYEARAKLIIHNFDAFRSNAL
ncbi:MAG: hypothetical protein ACO1OO_09595 [Flavisolibacter sp.]